MAQRVDIQYVKFYTQGSAARRVAPVVPYLISALPKLKKQKQYKLYIDPVAILGTAVAVCMLVMMAVGVNQLRCEQQKTAAIAEHVQLLQEENRALQAQYQEECDLEVIEKTALALGMIPQQNAEHISIEIQVPEAQEQVSLWQQIGTFLTGLFA